MLKHGTIDLCTIITSITTTMQLVGTRQSTVHNWPGCFRSPFSRDIRVFQFRFPDCRHRSSLVERFVAFGDIWDVAPSMRRGRAPADNSDVLAMFRLQYSGERATQPLVDDAS